MALVYYDKDFKHLGVPDMIENNCGICKSIKKDYRKM